MNILPQNIRLTDNSFSVTWVTGWPSVRARWWTRRILPNRYPVLRPLSPLARNCRIAPLLLDWVGLYPSIHPSQRKRQRVKFQIFPKRKKISFWRYRVSEKRARPPSRARLRPCWPSRPTSVFGYRVAGCETRSKCSKTDRKIPRLALPKFRRKNTRQHPNSADFCFY